MPKKSDHRRDRRLDPILGAPELPAETPAGNVQHAIPGHRGTAMDARTDKDD